MKPFDDSIPEEREPSHAALVSMLRQASPAPVQLPPRSRRSFSSASSSACNHPTRQAPRVMSSQVGQLE